MHPLRTVRPDVGLGGGVSHRVIADPRGQVDIECAGIDDAICVHQAPFGQLQNGKKRGPSEGGGAWNTLLSGEGKKAEPCTSICNKAKNAPSLNIQENPVRTPLVSFKMHLSEDAIICVFITRTALQMVQELTEPIKSEC